MYGGVFVSAATCFHSHCSSNSLPLTITIWILISISKLFQFIWWSVNFQIKFGSRGKFKFRATFNESYENQANFYILRIDLLVQYFSIRTAYLAIPHKSLLASLYRTLCEAWLSVCNWRPHIHARTTWKGANNNMLACNILFSTILTILTRECLAMPATPLFSWKTSAWLRYLVNFLCSMLNKSPTSETFGSSFKTTERFQTPLWALCHSWWLN